MGSTVIIPVTLINTIASVNRPAFLWLYVNINSPKLCHKQEPFHVDKKLEMTNDLGPPRCRAITWHLNRYK
jgi:hypothetical protein